MSTTHHDEQRSGNELPQIIQNIYKILSQSLHRWKIIAVKKQPRLWVNNIQIKSYNTRQFWKAEEYVEDPRQWCLQS